MNESSTQRQLEHSLQMLREMHANVEAHAKALNRIIRQLQIAVLTLSLITTGSVWALISNSAAEFAKWCGAILGTILTGVTSYQTMNKFEDKYSATLTLYGDIGATMSTLRQTTVLTPNDFWIPYKSFETKCIQLNIPLPPNLKHLSERWGQTSAISATPVNPS